MSEVLDILLAGTARNVQKEPQTREYRVMRLSKELGHDVVFQLHGMSYGQVKDLEKDPDLALRTTLAGVSSPDFRDKRLAVHYGLLQEGEEWGAHGVNPPDLVRAMLLPGEISAISKAVEQLSGYRTVTLSAVKKN